eukprot:TRINITY_DN12845_c0_g1_i4.p1 TRINITY_DN12845_c0_g1~~TRINITY_DN12845_c0_g1_i4.p1  ORF type:complete len:375 (-),score=72.05 TRINITY_DN12845_c0_g1_i4:428-1552(-)
MFPSAHRLYNSLPSACNATFCPQADWAGCVLRMAGHDFMDYADGEGGSDGCIDFHDMDNAGLAECLHLGEFGISMADAYEDFCTSISLADFTVVAAEAVMKLSRQHVLDEDPTRSPVDFRSKFRYGRTTAQSCEFAEGRLPNPENSCSAVQLTFVERMGLTWEQAAALMGVHTLGRAKVENSGYDGWWSDAENSRKFNNNYYTSILGKGWGPETSINGNPNKNQWKRIDRGADDAVLGKEMMLNTDMCFVFTMDNDGEIELDARTAKENECECAWYSAVKVSDATEKYMDGKFCGSTEIPAASNFPLQRAICCGDEHDTTASLPIDCGLVVDTKGPAEKPVRAFANNEDIWLRQFSNAWAIATSNGFEDLKRLQ